MNYNQLVQQQTLLEKELMQIKNEGWYLLDVRLERSAAGGNASIDSKRECKYARLRIGRGKLLPNGKKSQYIPISEINQYEVAIARGKAVRRLEKQLTAIQLKKEKIIAQAEKLGLEIPLHNKRCGD